MEETGLSGSSPALPAVSDAAAEPAVALGSSAAEPAAVVPPPPPATTDSPAAAGPAAITSSGVPVLPIAAAVGLGSGTSAPWTLPSSELERQPHARPAAEPAAADIGRKEAEQPAGVDGDAKQQGGVACASASALSPVHMILPTIPEETHPHKPTWRRGYRNYGRTEYLL